MKTFSLGEKRMSSVHISSTGAMVLFLSKKDLSSSFATQLKEAVKGRKNLWVRLPATKDLRTHYIQHNLIKLGFLEAEPGLWEK